jgi:hypothetical protein
LQPVEALRLVIGASEKRALVAPTQEERDQLAQAEHMCRAILDAALPIARFQCMVTIEKIGERSKLGLGDFTVCGLTIPAIRNGLVGLSMEKVTVYARLWERMQEGADMLSGYQGDTKTLGFRNWLKSLDEWEAERKRTIEVANGPQA